MRVWFPRARRREPPRAASQWPATTLRVATKDLAGDLHLPLLRGSHHQPACSIWLRGEPKGERKSARLGGQIDTRGDLERRAAVSNVKMVSLTPP